MKIKDVLLPQWCGRCGNPSTDDSKWVKGLFVCPKCAVYVSRKGANRKVKKKRSSGICKECKKFKELINGLCAKCRENRSLPRKIVNRIKSVDPEVYGHTSAEEFRGLLLCAPKLLQKRYSGIPFDLRKWRLHQIERTLASDRMDPKYKCNRCKHQLPLDVEARFLLGVVNAIPELHPCFSCPTDESAGKQRWKNFSGK